MTKGGWLYGIRHGHGKYTWKNGDIYIGNWIRGQKNGKGKIAWTSGNFYKGDWKNDKRTGQGKIEWHDGGELDGDVYEGELKFGKSELKSPKHESCFVLFKVSFLTTSSMVKESTRGKMAISTSAPGQAV